jgi:hypothetical protein
VSNSSPRPLTRSAVVPTWKVGRTGELAIEVVNPAQHSSTLAGSVGRSVRPSVPALSLSHEGMEWDGRDDPNHAIARVVYIQHTHKHARGGKRPGDGMEQSVTLTPPSIPPASSAPNFVVHYSFMIGSSPPANDRYIDVRQAIHRSACGVLFIR